MSSVSKGVRTFIWALMVLAVLAPGVFTMYNVWRASASEVELWFNPIFAPTWRLATADECDPAIVQDDPTQKYCVWNIGFYLKRYPAWDQTTAVCDGDDVIITGVQNKVRDIEYQDLTLFLYFRGQFMQFYKRDEIFPDNPIRTTRPTGLYKWGPWRIPGACFANYDEWGAVLRYTNDRGINLYTSVGPFPLPAERAGRHPTEKKAGGEAIP